MSQPVEASLLKAINMMTTLPSEEAKRLVDICQQKNILKGEHFIKAGQVPDKLAFVYQGLFRYYYADSNGKEYTKSFFTENSFITSYSAMIKGIGSYYTIEALEDSLIIVIDNVKWKKLFDGYAGWSTFLIKLLEKGYIKKEAREREFLQCDAEERYQIFLQEYPQLESRIRQHLIASYLGITPVALSRIRKKLGRVNIG